MAVVVHLGSFTIPAVREVNRSGEARIRIAIRHVGGETRLLVHAHKLSRAHVANPFGDELVLRVLVCGTHCLITRDHVEILGELKGRSHLVGRISHVAIVHFVTSAGDAHVACAVLGLRVQRGMPVHRLVLRVPRHSCVSDSCAVRLLQRLVRHVRRGSACAEDLTITRVTSSRGTSSDQFTLTACVR